MYEAHYHECRICGNRYHRLQVHMKLHGISLHQYEERFDFIPTVERILARTAKVGDCIEYKGAASRDTGYGQTRFAGKKIPASRAIYMAIHKVILSKDQVVCHSCDNPKCVNPDHLWLGTQRENAQDKVNKKRDRTYLKVDRVLGDHIRSAVRAGESQASMVRSYRLSPATVSMVVDGRRGIRDASGYRV